MQTLFINLKDLILNMKKIVYILLSASSVICMLTASSCKKDYKCTCTFNGNIVYSDDLGKETKKDAKDDCSRNDSTVSGELWNCTVN